MKENWDKGILSLALCTAVLPPIWAVAALQFHISTGGVALICAGLYAANGNRRENALKMSTGLLLGDLWAWLALHIMSILPLNTELKLFLILAVLGGAAILLSALLSRWIFCPGWLCGWAVGMTILSLADTRSIKETVLQIAIAMLVGVWYVGVFGTFAQKKISQLLMRDAR